MQNCRRCVPIAKFESDKSVALKATKEKKRRKLEKTSYKNHSTLRHLLGD